MSLQTLNLNLSLTININQDGTATVTVNPDLPTTVKPAEAIKPAQDMVEAPTEVKNAREKSRAKKDAPAQDAPVPTPVSPPPVIVTDEDKQTVVDKAETAVKEADKPVTPPPAPAPVPPAPVPPAPVPPAPPLTPEQVEAARKLQAATKVFGNDPNLSLDKQRSPITPPPPPVTPAPVPPAPPVHQVQPAPVPPAPPVHQVQPAPVPMPEPMTTQPDHVTAGAVRSNNVDVTMDAMWHELFGGVGVDPDEYPA